jgi:hypothetical protein
LFFTLNTLSFDEFEDILMNYIKLHSNDRKYFYVFGDGGELVCSADFTEDMDKDGLYIYYTYILNSCLNQLNMYSLNQLNMYSIQNINLHNNYKFYIHFSNKNILKDILNKKNISSKY